MGDGDIREVKETMNCGYDYLKTIFVSKDEYEKDDYKDKRITTKYLHKNHYSRMVKNLPTIKEQEGLPEKKNKRNVKVESETNTSSKKNPDENKIIRKLLQNDPTAFNTNTILIKN